MACPMVCVDAFTERPFAGNAAAVCVLDGPRAAAWMQRVAAEMNLAETAFLERRRDAAANGDLWSLRWFTPRVEVDLCGHATLAAAHVLWTQGLAAPERAIRFETRSGLLSAARAGAMIELDFPAEPASPVEAPTGLATALGASLLWVGRNRMDYLVEVAGEAQLRALAPNMTALAAIATRGFIVTCRAERGGADFISRFFAPGVGIDEDPVTGSAHCALGPFWAARLGRTTLAGYQASARGGFVRVECRGERVGLGGHAVTVYSGTLSADADRDDGVR